MAKRNKSPLSTEATRARRIRVVAGFGKSKDFAQYLGISETRWNNIENGQRISYDVFEKVRQKIPGVSVDYFWFGDTDKLSVELARKLGELPADEQSSKTRA